MIAVTLTLVTLLLGALAGLIIYRWRREKPLSQAWVIGSLLLAALISIVTGVTYAYYWSRYPSSDSELFKPDELVLAFGDEAVPDETGRERIGSPNRLVFQQPASAGVGIDFNVRLRVAPITAPGPIQVELSAPQSLEIRTEYKCPASDPVAAAGSACGSVTNHVFEVDWTITPKSISSSDLWIILPPDLRPTTLYGSDWSAFPYIEGRALTWGPGNRGSDAAPKSWPRNPRIIDTEEQYRSKEARREAVRLDAGLPKLFYQGYRVDLSRGRLGAQTTIVRTLGVSDHVYTLLALIGTVAASALGSGWLIQLLAWWKKKKTGGQPAAPPSSQAV